MIAYRFPSARGASLSRLGYWLLFAGTLALSTTSFGNVLVAAEDYCVECHSSDKFLVTNKKLYDYYRLWEVSVHGQEGTGCSDCHGGNPAAKDKDAAHQGAALPGSVKTSPVNYQNIPKTCGQCHEEIYQHYTTSKHYKKLLSGAKEGKPIGPNCVTCHGSVNTGVLNVRTVRDTCQKCHNRENDNHPDTADRAEEMLNEFLSVHRYYRFLTVRGDRAASLDFYRVVEKETDDLMMFWHTFDLDAIGERTHTLITALKEKRNEMLESSRKKEK